MRKWCLIMAVELVLLLGSVYADTAQMKISVVKIVNQLQAINPLINQAKAEQPNHPRIKIHFDSWVGPNGHLHNGLRQDIETIQHALMNAINQKNSDPRFYQPIKGDFIGNDHV